MCLAHCSCKGSPTRGLPTAAWQGCSAGLVHVQRNLAKVSAFSESAKHASFDRRAFLPMNGTFLFYREEGAGTALKIKVLDHFTQKIKQAASVTLTLQKGPNNCAFVCKVSGSLCMAALSAVLCSCVVTGSSVLKL